MQPAIKFFRNKAHSEPEQVVDEVQGVLLPKPEGSLTLGSVDEMRQLLCRYVASILKQLRSDAIFMIEVMTGGPFVSRSDRCNSMTAHSIVGIRNMLQWFETLKFGDYLTCGTELRDANYRSFQLNILKKRLLQW